MLNRKPGMKSMMKFSQNGSKGLYKLDRLDKRVYIM